MFIEVFGYGKILRFSTFKNNAVVKKFAIYSSSKLLVIIFEFIKISVGKIPSYLSQINKTAYPTPLHAYSKQFNILIQFL
jgi:hypothetical protein